MLRKFVDMEERDREVSNRGGIWPGKQGKSGSLDDVMTNESPVRNELRIHRVDHSKPKYSQANLQMLCAVIH